MLRKSGRLRAGDLTCKGNPTKVSLAYIPFLAIYRSAHGQQNLWTITKKDFKRNLEVLFLLLANRCATRPCGIYTTKTSFLFLRKSNTKIESCVRKKERIRQHANAIKSMEYRK